VTSSGKSHDLGLVAGILLVLSVFWVAAYGTIWLLLLGGWTPWTLAYLYGGVGAAFIVGAFAVYVLFRWAKKPKRVRGTELGSE
jgi:hypothetical protein